MEQFRLELSTDGERLAGEFILASLDDSGFLDSPLEEIAMETDTDMDDVEGAILIIRELEPIGCGAQNMIESLVFQAEILYPEDPFFPDLIRNYLPEFELKQYEAIGAEADMHPEDVEEYHQMLLKFNPRPGSVFGASPQPIIKPDVKIARVGNEWKVLSTDEGTPRIRLSHKFQQQLREASLKREDKAFMSEFQKKAEFFLHALLRREQTILRVTRSILDRQLEYFEFGEEYLRPLALRQVSEDTELHESTISRSTANKYVETPNGIFELKWFFCSGVKGLYGDEYAQQAIQVKIRRFIEDENRQKPFSDQAIQKRLSEEGIQIARRTVSKYRESIGIPSGRDRKKRYAVLATVERWLMFGSRQQHRKDQNPKQPPHRWWQQTVCSQFTQDVWLQPIAYPQHAQKWMNQTENGTHCPWQSDNWIDNTQSKGEETKPADSISFEPSFEMNDATHQNNDRNEKEGSHPPSVGFKSIEFINANSCAWMGRRN